MNKFGNRILKLSADAVIDVVISSMGYPSIGGAYQPVAPHGLTEYAEKHETLCKRIMNKALKK